MLQSLEIISSHTISCCYRGGRPDDGLHLPPMASASFALGNFQRDNSRARHKEFQNCIPPQGIKQEILRSESLQIGPDEIVDFHKSNLTFECNQLATPVPTVNRPVLIDVQDTHPDSVLFSFGIVEQCIRREKILDFLASGSNVSNGRDLDYSILRDLMGLHTLDFGMYSQQQIPMYNDLFLYGAADSNIQSPLRCSHTESLSSRFPVNFDGDVSCDSTIMKHQDRQVLFMGDDAKIRALLSTMVNVYVSKSTTAGVQRHEMVVPYFRRWGPRSRNKTQASAKVQDAVVAPSKRTKVGKMQNKRQKRKSGVERDSFKNNYSQACESLLSVILIRKQNEMALYSLKQHGHQFPELLMQFSAGIAGAGLAILFSVVWKLTSGKAPLCTTKLLNTGLGVGMVWLSHAVNMLRDTIIEINKHAYKLKLKEDEMADKIEESVKEVLFRAAAVMAVVVLKFA